MSLFKKLFTVASTVALVAGGLLAPSAALAAAHGAGSVVKSTDGTVWFITSDGHRRAFTSGGAMLSYGFLNFSQVVDANADDLALPTGDFIPPRDGSIFCATQTKGSDVAGECSFISGGMKSAFTSASVFGGQGFSFSRAQYGDSSFLSKGSNISDAAAAHKPGALVNQSGTVYLVGSSSLLGIPSVDVFNSWGYSFADAVTANAADMGMTKSGVMVARVAGQLNPSFTSTPGGSTGGPLEGGAGDLTLTSTSSDVEDTVKEGENNVKIFGVKGEADGSDIAITSVKVSFVNCDNTCTGAAATSSENFLHYVDTVSVYLGDTKVGSASADSFNKDTGSPDEFSKTIALDGAVIRDQDSAKLYVAVSAIDSIDSDDITNATWGIQLDTMRFTDATGAVLSADVADFDTYAENDQFTFDDASADDLIELKSSSANPDDSNVQVDTDLKSDSTLALAFKLDVGDDSNDVDVTSLTFTVNIVDLDSDNDGDITAETVAGGSDLDLIDSMEVKIGGDTYNAELDDGSVTIDADGDGTATYTADTTGLTINGGDNEEGKVYVVFGKADLYNEDQVTAQVSLNVADIAAETSEDELSVGGGTIDGTDQDGAVLTPSLSGATVDVTDTSHSQNDAGTMGTFTFEVTVTADGADVDVDETSVVETVLGGADTSYTSISIVNLDGDATENGANDYTVVDGDSNTFSITYTHDPDNAGSYYIRLDSIDGVVVDELNGPESLAAA